jgi:signal transduction histidine kinase
MEVAIYRTVQEALHNIAKHARARSFSIAIEERKSELILLIEDDGTGVAKPGKSPYRSFGLRGMKERIAALGGDLQIRFRSGEGTRLRIVIPLSGRVAAASSRRSSRRKLVRLGTTEFES